MVHVVNCLLLFGGLFSLVLAASRTSPPAGAVIVRSGTTATGEFATISAAISSLPNDKTNQSIFIFPGTYTEQVDITRTGALTVNHSTFSAGMIDLTSYCQIYGYTNNTSSYIANQVTLQAGVPASTAGSDDASGTLRIHTDNFRMYNVNVKNTFGIGSQAIAISQYGNRVGLYACGFYGYQDTLYANKGAQVYLKGYIEVRYFGWCTNILRSLLIPALCSHSSRGRSILFLVALAWHTLEETQSRSKPQGV